ncbi:hypothetical protein H920_11679 [Fukomys damarensis]|uniref:Uncharacterized protein n=1 Tax=Fukomys damarensis TaxID=885580 RepID=A0A091D481_FUKDA|nr:hypothetical protein H920_11679 [Fukomys damarensis]
MLTPWAVPASEPTVRRGAVPWASVSDTLLRLVGLDSTAPSKLTHHCTLCVCSFPAELLGRLGPDPRVGASSPVLPGALLHAAVREQRQQPVERIPAG